MNFPGYSAYFDGSNFNKNDGVVLLVSSRLCHDVEVVTFAAFRFIRVTVGSGSKKVSVTGIYVTTK